MEKDQILNTFSWEDKDSYRWVFKAPDKVMLSIFGTMLFFISTPTIIYALLYLVGLISLKVSFYIAFVLFIIWLGYIVLSLISIFTGNEKMKNMSRAYMRSQSFVFIAFAAYVISSPVSFWSLSFMVPSEIYPIGLSEWIRYFLDNVFSVVFIGIFDIFDIRLSDITPLTWGSRAMIYLFNIVLAIGIIDAIVEIFSTRKDAEFVGTVQDLFHKCDSMTDRSRYTVNVEGIYSPLENTITLNAQDFVEVFRKEENPAPTTDEVEEVEGEKAPE